MNSNLHDPVPPPAAPLSDEAYAAAYDIPPEAIPRVDDIIIQDGKPVESVFIEKQRRLLTAPLYASWAGPGEGRPFQVLANVGLFHTYKRPPLVPDAMLSVDVQCGDLSVKENRSYFAWYRGKMPDVVIEVVSDETGGEDKYKLNEYARIGVPHYVVFDPDNLLRGGVLRAFVLRGGVYEPTEEAWFPPVGLGLTLWQGEYEGQSDTWLRWCDRDGGVIASGHERANQEHQRADQEHQRAEQLEAEVARLRALLEGKEPGRPLQ